jgi:hypothetical protein
MKSTQSSKGLEKLMKTQKSWKKAKIITNLFLIKTDVVNLSKYEDIDSFTTWNY